MPITHHWCTPESVPHQHRNVGVVQHVARDTAEQQLAQRMVLIGTHHQHVGTEFVCSREQRRAERARADGQLVQFRVDAMLRENRRHRRRRAAGPCAGKHEHALDIRETP